MNQLQMINRMLWGGNNSPILQLLGNTVGNSDSEWIDTSSYNTNATQSNILYQPVLTNDAFGLGNKGYVFDGTNDYMIVPDSDRFTFADGNGDLPFKIKIKLKLTSISDEWILNKRGSTSGEMQIVCSSGKLSIVLFSEGSTSIYIGCSLNELFSLSTIYDLEINYDGSGSKNGFSFKLSGIEKTDISPFSSGTYVKMTNTNHDITIGKRGWLNSGYISGSLTDIEIWKGVV